MKIFRFEHKKFKTGMFTTKPCLLSDSDAEIQSQIQEILMDKYYENNNLLPDQEMNIFQKLDSTAILLNS
jgi:hypothetical protein